MKYLLLFGIIMGVIWWLKLSRRSGDDQQATLDEPQTMVRCLHCGLHLPSDEALLAQTGIYCGKEHRDLHERGHV
jgi:uncharacterized protein